MTYANNIEAGSKGDDLPGDETTENRRANARRRQLAAIDAAIDAIITFAAVAELDRGERERRVTWRRRSRRSTAFRLRAPTSSEGRS